MWTEIFCTLIVASAARAQLNYEGNPVSDNTVYTAEESQVSERAARAESSHSSDTQSSTEDSYLAAANSLQAERAQKLYPVYAEGSKDVVETAKSTSYVPQDSKSNETAAGNRDAMIASSNQQQNAVFVTPRPEPVPTPEARLFQTNELDSKKQIFVAAQNEQLQPSFPSESALAMFMNSRTPEESQMALDQYLQSSQQQLSQSTGQQQQPHISQITIGRQQLDDEVQELDQQQVQQIYPQSVQASYNLPVDQQLRSPQQLRSVSGSMQQTQTVQLQGQQDFDLQGQTGLGFQGQPGFGVQGQPGSSPLQGIDPAGPRPSRIRSRNDFVHVGRRPMYRRPGRRPYRPQSRIGSPGLYKAPPLSIGNKFKQPVEVIYTRPPGLGHGSPHISNPPVPYEDASAWFPDADAAYPPPDSKVYYSQLKQQSYDPFHFNHIPKYYKTKPYFYEKGGKDGDSMWSVLFNGFKKHGMKNLMNPMFLLGVSIPTITLMLSALANTRALGRSNSGDVAAQKQLEEILERLQKAQKCFEENAQGTEQQECFK